MVAVVVAIAAAGGGGRKGVVCVGALTAMFVLLSLVGSDNDAVMLVVLPVEEVDGSIEACVVGTVPTGTDIVAVAAGQGLLASLAWSTALVLWVCATAVS